MNRITKLEKKYSNMKNFAGRQIKKGKYDKACDVIKYCSNYKYFLNDIYYDNDLELYLKRISEDYKRKILEWKSCDKIMFYDQLSRDSRVLSLHYLKALIKSGKEFIYVYYEDNDLNREIKKICNRNRITTYRLGLKYKTTVVDALIRIFNHEKPGVVLTQCHIDDYVAAIFNYAIKGINNVKNYFINISDHTFWLGRGAYYKYIEFRNCGYTISVEKRDILDEQLLKLPYYAMNSIGKYKGLNKSLINKKILLSGGSLYKLYGKDDYFDIVNYLLRKYDECVLLYLTNENPSFIYRKIDECNKSRVFVEKERDDLDDVMKHSFIYLNSYPIGGALMTLMAANNCLIPLTLFNKNDMLNDLRDFFSEDVYDIFLFSNKEDLKRKMVEYISNPFKYSECKNAIYKGVVKSNDFDSNFLLLMNEDKTNYLFKHEYVNYDYIIRNYRRVINDRIPEIVFSSRSVFVFLKFPFSFTKGAFEIIRNKGWTFFLKKTKKYLFK